MKDDYPSVLKLLGQRNATDSDTMFWIAVLLFTLPVLLLLGNYLRLYLQRRSKRAYGYDLLEKLAAEKGLSYPEQVLVENIADAANLNNPAQLLSSVETFDRAIAIYMDKVQKMGWLEMDEQVDHIYSTREKVGFQYLSPERPPISTRELKVGQQVYSLAASPKGVRLIYADIFDINDLAIFIRPFRTAKNMVKLGKKNAIWGFFWSEGGLEYRFRTNPMKEIRRPAHHLLLKHGDELHHNPNQDVFTCRYNAEIVVTWVAAQTYGSNLSPNIFERVENPETLALSLVYVSGSGFGLSFDGRVEVDDLVRIQGGDKLPSFLEDQIGRVVRATTDALECRFLTMDAEKHHLLLTYIASKMTVDDFQKRLKARRVAKRTQK